MDFIGPLPDSQGFNALLVIVDYFSKMIKLEPTTVEATSQDVARLLRKRVFRDHGLPRTIVHDRDTKFVSEWMTELNRLLGIEQNPSTAYHPQTDGQTERANQEIEKYLRAYVNYLQDDWVEWLDLGEFALNDREHSTTKQTPFFLNTGQHPWKGDIGRRETKVQSVEEMVNKFKEIRRQAEESWKQATSAAKKSNDRKARRPVNFKPGDQVYLSATNITTSRPSKKLDDKRYGPFKVIRKVKEAAYELDIPKTWRGIHPVIHEEYLTLFTPPSFSSQLPPPPPPAVEVEGQLEYEVEQILDTRDRRHKIQYLVKWLGYPQEEATWEPFENVKNSPELLREFHERFPERPRHPEAIKMLKIRKIDYRGWNSRLFHPRDGTHGSTHSQPASTPPTDFIIPLPDQVITNTLSRTSPYVRIGLVQEQQNVFGFAARKMDISTLF
jgi:hypothetical protein